MSLEKMVCGVNYTTELIKNNINSIIDSLEKGFATVRFAELVEDPTSRDSVDAAVTALNAMLKDDDVVDLSGTYVWPTVNFTTGTKNNIKYKNGTFKRLDDIGVEYLFWLNGEDSSVSYCNFDGGSAIIPTWGQQCIYIPEAVNVKVHANTFRNIGDAAVRYSRNTDNIDELTKKVIITNNLFLDCGQITSNDTGVEELLVTGNIFDNTPIKLTQRQTLTGSGTALISANVFIQEKRDAKVLEIQGGENVMFTDNHIKAENLETLIGMYPNISFKANQGDERILLKNVIVKNNKMLLKDIGYGFYIEGKDAENDDPLINDDSTIHVSNNIVWHEEVNKTDTSFINLYSQSTVHATPSSVARVVSIKHNELYGQFGRLLRMVRVGFNPHHKLIIEGNFCDKLTTSFARMYVNGLNGEEGDIFIERNRFTAPKVFDNFTNADNKRVNSLTYSDNEAQITNQTDIFDVNNSNLELDFEKIAKKYKLKRNTFDSENGDYTGSCLAITPAPDAAQSVGTELQLIDNVLLKQKINPNTLNEPEALKVNASSGDGTIESLYCRGNNYGGDLLPAISNEPSVNIADINLTSF